MQVENRKIRYLELIGYDFSVRMHDVFEDVQTGCLWTCYSIISKTKHCRQQITHYYFFPDKRIYQEDGEYKRRKNLKLCTDSLKNYLQKKDWIKVTVNTKTLNIIKYDQRLSNTVNKDYFINH